MSMKKISATEWMYTSCVGSVNDDTDIEFTADGLVIGGSLITWDEIEKAQLAVNTVSPRAAEQIRASYEKACRPSSQRN